MELLFFAIKYYNTYLICLSIFLLVFLINYYTWRNDIDEVSRAIMQFFLLSVVNVAIIGFIVSSSLITSFNSKLVILKIFVIFLIFISIISIGFSFIGIYAISGQDKDYIFNFLNKNSPIIFLCVFFITFLSTVLTAFLVFLIK